MCSNATFTVVVPAPEEPVTAALGHEIQADGVESRTPAKDITTSHKDHSLFLMKMIN
jgi:hypothetical protein